MNDVSVIQPENAGSGNSPTKEVKLLDKIETADLPVNQYKADTGTGCFLSNVVITNPLDGQRVDDILEQASQTTKDSVTATAVLPKESIASALTRSLSSDMAVVNSIEGVRYNVLWTE